MWESRSRTTSWPACVWATTETRLPMVPEATKTAASLPRRAAAIASRRWTVGSSPQTSSPTSARAMASRISGVGSVSVSERRSTMSCTMALLPLGARDGAQPLGRALAELGVAVLVDQLAQEVGGLARLALGEVDLGQREQRLRDHERARIFLDDELQPRPGRRRVALVEVVAGDPQLLLGQLAAADVDLAQRVGGVAAVGIVLHQLLELLEGLGGEALVLL